MPAPDDFLYEYAVIRYVPRVDREEFINIGLLMMCKRRKWLKGKIGMDKNRIGVFDPYVDFKNLEEQAAMFIRNDIPSTDLPVEEKYRWLSSVKSSVIQVSSSHPGIINIIHNIPMLKPTEILESEFDRLFKEIVIM